MRELFEAIGQCEAGSVNLVLTALDGAWLGEKALVSDGKLGGRVWKQAFLQDMRTKPVS